MLQEWISKCRCYLRGRSAIDTELREEMQAHLEFEIDESMDKGETQEDARRRFGNTTLIRETAAGAWGFAGIDAIAQDLKYGFRQLRRSPVFTAAAMVTLGLGIGMSTAMFSVVNAVLLRPLSYPDADRLVWLATYDPAANEDIVPRFDFRAWKAQARSFDRMVAYTSDDVTVAVDDRTLQTRVASVSPDFWEISGARPAIGRLPDSGEQSAVIFRTSSLNKRLAATQPSSGELRCWMAGPSPSRECCRVIFSFSLSRHRGVMWISEMSQHMFHWSLRLKTTREAVDVPSRL